MVKENYVAPEFVLSAFNCTLCGVYSHQQWHEIIYRPKQGIYEVSLDISQARKSGIRGEISSEYAEHVSSINKCTHCNKYTIWVGTNMVFPNNTSVQPPNDDMPEDIIKIYNEASSIVNLSAKSAAALLRLALENLLIHLGAKKGTIDVMIQDLIDKDVISASGSVRKALDSLRLLGNAGVHQTGINLDEDPNAAFALFKVLNFVVEKLITEEKEMESIYALIPEGKRENLDNRRSK